MVSVGNDAKAANFPVGVVENGEMRHPLSWPLAAAFSPRPRGAAVCSPPKFAENFVVTESEAKEIANERVKRTELEAELEKGQLAMRALNKEHPELPPPPC